MAAKNLRKLSPEETALVMRALLTHRDITRAWGNHRGGAEARAEAKACTALLRRLERLKKL